MYKLNDFELSKDDDRDFIVDIGESIPQSYRVEELSKPYNQGTEGSCSAYTVACIKQYQEYLENKYKINFSTDYIYTQRANRGTEGMTPRNTMKILMEEGALPKENWKNSYKKAIPEEIKLIARNFKIKGYARAYTIENIKEAIYKHGICYMAVPVYHFEKNFWHPQSEDQKRIGGHAIACVGYEQNRGFELRNSWGISWGDSGYTYLPFEDHSYILETWVLIDDTTVGIYKNRKKSRKIFGNR